jgi:hypothetical protein
MWESEDGMQCHKVLFHKKLICQQGYSLLESGGHVEHEMSQLVYLPGMFATMSMMKLTPTHCGFVQVEGSSQV